MNRTILSGRLVADPEAIGDKGCKFTVAVQDGFGDKQYTSFVPVVAWAKPSESILKYFKKGDGIVLEGRMRQERWEKEGKKQQKIGIVLDKFEFPITKKENKETTASEKPFNDEEIPF